MWCCHCLIQTIQCVGTGAGDEAEALAIWQESDEHLGVLWAPQRLRGRQRPRPRGAADWALVADGGSHSPRPSSRWLVPSHRPHSWYGMVCNALHHGNPIPSIPTCTSLHCYWNPHWWFPTWQSNPSTNPSDVCILSRWFLTFLELYDINYIPNHSHRRCGPPNVQIWAKFCCIQHSERNPSMQLWVRPSA